MSLQCIVNGIWMCYNDLKMACENCTIVSTLSRNSENPVINTILV